MQGVHSERLLQLYAPEAYIAGAAAGAVQQEDYTEVRQ